MPGKQKTSIPILIAVAVAVLATFGLFYYLSGGDGKKISASPVIGGAFDLLDQDGKAFTQENLKGKYSLVYFGYTHCPDVCPTELQDMTTALEKLGSLADKIRPIMISVDPKRDTPAALKEYMSNFYPGFIGLTGTAEQVRKASSAYRAYYRKADDKKGGDYTMDHSSIVYFMDPEGRYLRHFAYGVAPEKMVSGMKMAIKKHEGS
jgi:protein SCO1/2